jgi:polyhydroxyalkanoate synthesis regulator phasin
MKIKLKTNDFSTELGKEFRDDLVENFAKTEEAINQLETGSSDEQVTKGDLDDLKSDNDELKKRINRILLGTDVESIEIVVNRILKEKGVSN